MIIGDYRLLQQSPGSHSREFDANQHLQSLPAKEESSSTHGFMTHKGCNSNTDEKAVLVFDMAAELAKHKENLKTFETINSKF